MGDLISDTSLQCELWHQKFSHLHYKALPGVRRWSRVCLSLKLTMKVFVKVV